MKPQLRYVDENPETLYCDFTLDPLCEENPVLPPFSSHLVSNISASDNEYDKEIGENSIISQFSSSSVRDTHSESEDEDELDLSESNLVNSLPLLECTPLVIKDISTPNVTVFDVSDVEAADNFEGGISKKDTDLDLKKALLSAGYHQSTIKAALKRYKDVNDDSSGRNRPMTNIFSQGWVYTYPKIDSGVSNNRVAVGSKGISLINKSSPKSVSGLTDPNSLSSESPDLFSDAGTILKQIRISNLKNVVIGQLNINSLRNKFYGLVELIHGNLDILIITEIKLDDTFSEKQFLMPGYRKSF